MAQTSKLTQALLTRAGESLASAQLLLNSALYDDAVSRTYYAMFYAAKAALDSIDIKTRSHAEVINQFGLQFIKSSQLDNQYGKMLTQVFQSRQISDYDVQSGIPSVEAKNIVANAEQFVTKIKDFLSKLP